MNTESIDGPLPLAQAIILWSDPALVDVIRRSEDEFSTDLIRTANWYRVDELRRLRQPPVRQRWISMPSFMKDTLLRLWEDLFAEFRAAIERGDIGLEGSCDQGGTVSRHTLPAAMAARYEFDPPSNTVFLPNRVYYGVEVTRGGVTRSAAIRRPFNAAELTDAELLALINEHVDRVAASPEPKMMARIKDVLQPLILRRLEARCAQGLMAGSIAEEARQLQVWIREVASWHPIPKSGTIENNIRDAYNRLKARSRPMIP